MAAVVSLSTFDPRLDLHADFHAGRPGRSAGVRRHGPARAPRSHRSAAVYRRRRIVAGALGLGLLVAAGQASAALGGPSLTNTERRSPEVEAVVVEPGDTLWSVARRLAPDKDP